MSRAALAPVLLVVLALLAVGVVGPRTQARVAAATAPALPAREAGLRFAAGTHPLDQQAVLAAIARAQPEARRLIDVVDGAVTIEVGPADAANAAGVAHIRGGEARVVLDLGVISRRFGERGVTRLVLHELAHVVDHLLVPDDTAAALDAAVPQGYGCAAGDRDPSCAGRSDREERFAESFAKWAVGDIGMDLDFGYRVPPPTSLTTWGAPMSSLSG
ncbi:hypothetical protein DSM112329_02370 [Paraconexibacter sp. AEG42_29]|uniref:DUF4157 domain-containing protein n=1 Tax=Paraconexibacter sp. AEG42_29 TaxID=2997339 RepID=A0AAU7AV94_9ACTN